MHACSLYIIDMAYTFVFEPSVCFCMCLRCHLRLSCCFNSIYIHCLMLSHHTVFSNYFNVCVCVFFVILCARFLCDILNYFSLTVSHLCSIAQGIHSWFNALLIFMQCVEMTEEKTINSLSKICPHWDDLIMINSTPIAMSNVLCFFIPVMTFSI